MTSGSLIAAGQQLIGKIAGSGDLRVEGRLEGSVVIDGHLVVGEQALVLAETVQAHSVRIDGRVEGHVRAKTDVEIGKRGCLVGDVDGCLTVEEGGVFQGRITGSGTRAPGGKAQTGKSDTVPTLPPVHRDLAAEEGGSQAVSDEESSLPRPRLKQPRRLTQTFPPGTPAPSRSATASTKAATASTAAATEESPEAELSDDWFQ